MIYAYDVNQTHRYSLSSDKDGNPTVFILGVLDSRLSSFLNDKSRAFEVNGNGANAAATTVTIDLDQAEYKVVRYGLRGWENFKRPDGTDVPFETEMESIAGVGPRAAVKAKCMDCIKPFIKELARQILTDNVPTEQELKN